jgi:hypothetical protein
MPGWFKKELYFDEPGMKKRGILADTEFTKHFIEKLKTSKYEQHYKIWPKERGGFPTDTVSWSNKIFLIDLTDYPSGIIIEDAAMVKSFKMWFEFIWQHLPES